MIYIYMQKAPIQLECTDLPVFLAMTTLCFIPLPGELAVEHRNSRPQGTVNDNGNHFKVGLGSEQCTTTQTPW